MTTWNKERIVKVFPKVYLELNQRLSKNYKKRIENFVINMLEKPVVCNEYKPPEAY